MHKLSSLTQAIHDRLAALKYRELAEAHYREEERQHAKAMEDLAGELKAELDLREGGYPPQRSDAWVIDVQDTLYDDEYAYGYLFDKNLLELIDRNKLEMLRRTA